MAGLSDRARRPRCFALKTLLPPSSGGRSVLCRTEYVSCLSAEQECGFELERVTRRCGAAASKVPQRRSQSVYFLRHGQILPPDRELRVPDRLLRRGAGNHGNPRPERGHLGLRGAIVFGVLGAIVGNQIGYWVGYQAGRPFVLKWGRHVNLTPERLEWVEGLFARHGGNAVFAARFFSISRLLEALVAGMSRMPWGTFLIYSVLGGAVWATAVVLVGYFFGESRDSAQGWSGRAPLLLILLLGVGLGRYLAYRWTTSRMSR